MPAVQLFGYRSARFAARPEVALPDLSTDFFRGRRPAPTPWSQASAMFLRRRAEVERPPPGTLQGVRQVADLPGQDLAISRAAGALPPLRRPSALAWEAAGALSWVPGRRHAVLILSLFPGLELLDRAFREIPGWCVVAGPDRLLGADIRDFHPPAARFDGVIGGSPCQEFSALANLVRAKGLEPRFGNLVPEFERVVVEAQPLWFLHENVPRAPIPKPKGYRVKDFELCNSSIEGEDGLGQEQERVRRFTFGWNVRMVALRLCRTRELGSVVDLDPPNLLRWIPRAALRLPAQLRTGAILGEPVDNSPEAKGRVPAVVADARAVPVALGGSGKPKRTRQPGITGAHQCSHRPKGAALHRGEIYRCDGWRRAAFSHSGTDQRSRRKGRNKWIWIYPPDAAELPTTPDP